MPPSLIFLWALTLGASLVGGVSGSVTLQSLPSPPVLRVASSCVLVAGAWWCLAKRPAVRSSRHFTWAAIGMTLGALGDSLILISQERLPAPRLLLAMVLFGLGHVAYIRGLLVASREPPRPGSANALASGLIWILLVALAWQATVNAAVPSSPLRWPALAYSLLLGGTAAVSTALARRRSRYMPVAIGAALFLASDFVLAYQAFRGSFPFDTDLCWATYGPGQMLIVSGWLAAASQPARAKSRGR